MSSWRAQAEEDDGTYRVASKTPGASSTGEDALPIHCFQHTYILIEGGSIC